jgi:glycerophosphoryl diester phosphodiesterase
MWNSGRVLLAGHRGNSSQAPENTTVAFQSALDLGCDLIEWDYHHSADGVPVVIHDETLERTTDAVARWGGERLAVRDRTWEELAQLDAGSWFGEAFQGVRLATMAECLTLCRGRAVPLIEQKAGDAATCWRVLREAGMLEQAIVQSFDWTFLGNLSRLAPEVLLGALGEGEIHSDALERARLCGASFLGWNQEDLTKENVARAIDDGLSVSTWTVDDPRRADELISFGVTAVTTNVPALLRDVCDRRLR